MTAADHLVRPRLLTDARAAYWGFYENTGSISFPGTSFRGLKEGFFATYFYRLSDRLSRL
jgi:hypothetical protein